MMLKRNASKKNAGAIALVTGLVVALMAPLATAQKPAAPGVPEGEVSASGVFTGTLQGIVTLGEQEVLITSKTSFFRTGKGQTGPRNYISDDSVWVTGKMESGVLVARMVLITERPDNDQLHQLTDEHTKTPPNQKAQ